MARNKLRLEFKGFEEYAARLDELGGDLKAVTEKALKESHAFVTPKIKAAMTKHNRTGGTSRAILDKSPVVWDGAVASIDVGFDIQSGGMPSIFLMYGTKLHGQPHIAPDRKLYDAVYGAQTRKEISKIQEEAFEKVLERVVQNGR